MDGKDLTAWREAQGLTQGELARSLGVHIITVSRWENGARQIAPFLDLALKPIEREPKKKPTPKK
jgi:transcriptional regulator with XRE-family HTH domain